MGRAILISTVAGLPLVVALVVLANSVDLGRGVILGLFIMVVGLPALLGARLEDRRRHPPRAAARR